MAELSNGPSPGAASNRAARGEGPLSYMDAKKPHQDIYHYEGLVRKTAARLVKDLEDDFDEICQFLREKVWKGLESFSSQKVRTTSKYTPAQQCERYVFSCVTNGVKDLVKKKRRNLVFIEDIARLDDGEVLADSFFDRYLSIEDAYPSFTEVPLIPSTLSSVERRVVLFYYSGYTTAEIAVETALPTNEVLKAAATVREKMADWNPIDTGVPMPIAA